MSDTAGARDLWVRAVALGMRGAVARGQTCLNTAQEAVGRSEDAADRALLSLLSSTRASWLRQSGRHRLALVPDGRAALLAAVSSTGRDDDGWGRAAMGDALIGLAADNLGLGRFDASSRLLDRARTTVAGDRRGGLVPNEWIVDRRVALRWHWVSAENALYRGEVQAGRRWAREAERLARDCPSAHHRIKTRLIAAAATAAGGDIDEAAAEAGAVIIAADAAGLLPLRWAGSQMLAALDPSPAATRRVDETTAALAALGFFPGGDFNGR